MIRCFEGLPGMGKTMLMVHAALELAWDDSAVIVSNIKIIPPADRPVIVIQLPMGHDGFDTEALQELLDYCKEQGVGAVLALDEVGITMPARFWADFPVSLMYTISQSRKFGCDLLYTNQVSDDTEKFLRDRTDDVYRVRAFPRPTRKMRRSGKRPWFFVVTTWRPGTVGKRDRRIDRKIIRYRREWEDVYDTDEIVRPPARLLGRTARHRAG